jgi:hypothetical protein
MSRELRIVAALISAPAAFAAGWLLWVSALYFNVLPGPDRGSSLVASLWIAAAFAVICVAWLVAYAVGTPVDGSLRIRRVRELALVACIGAAAETCHIWMPRWFGRPDKPTGALIAAGLMAAVVVASFIRDRSVDVIVMLILLSLAGLVPVVLLGRVVGLFMARVLWSLHL